MSKKNESISISLDAYRPAEIARRVEHIIANMYIIPLGIFLGSELATWKGVFSNLLPVMLGNIFGGAGLVALVYWTCYLEE